MRVRFFMTVQESHNRWYGSHSELWTRTINMPDAPQRGERVELWPDGPMVEVKERWFNHRGEPYVDLRTCVIDPDSDEQRYQSHDPVPTSWSWWSAHERTPFRSGLTDGGWTTRPERREGMDLPADPAGPPETS